MRPETAARLSSSAESAQKPKEREPRLTGNSTCIVSFFVVKYGGDGVEALTESHEEILIAGIEAWNGETDRTLGLERTVHSGDGSIGARNCCAGIWRGTSGGGDHRLRERHDRSAA